MPEPVFLGAMKNRRPKPRKPPRTLSSAGQTAHEAWSPALPVELMLLKAWQHEHEELLQRERFVQRATRRFEAQWTRYAEGRTTPTTPDPRIGDRVQVIRDRSDRATSSSGSGLDPSLTESGPGTPFGPSSISGSGSPSIDPTLVVQVWKPLHAHRPPKGRPGRRWFVRQGGVACSTGRPAFYSIELDN